jgi:hypothetical protein
MLDHKRVKAVYDRLSEFELALLDIAEDAPPKLRADSLGILRVLEDYYGTHLYPRLVNKPRRV